MFSQELEKRRKEEEYNIRLDRKQCPNCGRYQVNVLEIPVNKREKLVFCVCSLSVREISSLY